MSGNPSMQQEVAEAMCAALYQTAFEPIGSTEDRAEGHAEWFTRGESPKNVRVSVRQPVMVNDVVVAVEWHNDSNGTRLKGQSKFTISTATIHRSDLNEATTNVMVRVLEIFRDVLQGTGVAGPIAELAPAAPEDVESET